MQIIKAHTNKIVSFYLCWTVKSGRGKVVTHHNEVLVFRACPQNNLLAKMSRINQRPGALSLNVFKKKNIFHLSNYYTKIAILSSQ